MNMAFDPKGTEPVLVGPARASVDMVGGAADPGVDRVAAVDPVAAGASGPVAGRDTRDGATGGFVEIGKGESGGGFGLGAHLRAGRAGTVGGLEGAAFGLAGSAGQVVPGGGAAVPRGLAGAAGPVWPGGAGGGADVPNVLTGEVLLPDGAPPVGEVLPHLDMAEVLFGSAASEMTRLLRRLESGDPIKPKEASDAATETRKALERLQDERNRVEQLRRTLAGGVGSRELDLGAARDEIGRRLACLRDSRGD